MYILGINLSHDRSACLLQDGRIVVAIAEERLDRVKRSTGHLIGPKYRIPPFMSIDYCLSSRNLMIDDLDLIVINHALRPENLENLKKLIPVRDKSKIQSIPHPSHHLSHAYSTYFCSSFEESAILIADVNGSEIIGKGVEGESGYYAKGWNIKPILKTYQVINSKNIKNNYYSLTYIYRFISLCLNFYLPYTNLWPYYGQPDEAGKTMALAAYGRKREDWPNIVETNSKSLTTYRFFNFVLKNKLGQIQNGRLLPINIRKSAEKLIQLHKDLAYKAQQELETGLLFLADKLYKDTKSSNLCVAGGAGLNCHANRKILDNTGFKNIFIQPAATDDGNAIGAALYGWFNIAKGKQRHPLNNVFLGRTYSQNEIKNALHIFDFNLKPLNQKELLLRTVDLIAKGKIVGWFQGGSEFGPRALGHRSILADPRRLDIPQILNKKVKHREYFQPFAASILQEFSNQYFDLPGDSPFMLLVAKVKHEKQGQIPAVVHYDGTTRLQTVSKSENTLLYPLIQKFYQLTGIPLLLNTSFNTKGQPIVETPEDGLLTFFNSDMDALVLGSFVLDKHDRRIKQVISQYRQEKRFFQRIITVEGDE